MDRPADWLAKAERDLLAARSLAAEGFHEWAAFAAQQGAEKAVKALVQSMKGAARGHSITGILERIQELVAIPDAVTEAARELDQVYVTARYPNGFAAGSPADYFSETTSRRLLAHATDVIEFCRSKVS